jgi:hypothetical protein
LPENPPPEMPPEPAPVALEPGRYSNKPDGFSVVFPPDWEQKENMMGSKVAAMSPLQPGDTFRENVNVVVENLTSPMDVETYSALNLTNLSRLMPAGAQPDVADAELGGVAAKRIIYETVMGQVRIKGMMILAVQGRHGYAVACSATPETFDAFRPTFDEIVGTFRFE